MCARKKKKKRKCVQVLCSEYSKSLLKNFKEIQENGEIYLICIKKMKYWVISNSSEIPNRCFYGAEMDDYKIHLAPLS